MIGFIVEDNAQEKAIIEITRKLGIQTVKRFIRFMDGNRLKKASKYVRDLVRTGCQKVIVLKDLEGAPPKVGERFKRLEFLPQAKLFIIVREIETWFLADEEALEDYLKVRIKPIPEPERVLNPKGFLNRLFEEVRGEGYHEEGIDPAEIARRLRLEVVERKCPSFKKFRELVGR